MNKETKQLLDRLRKVRDVQSDNIRDLELQLRQEKAILANLNAQIKHLENQETAFLNGKNTV